VLKRRHMPLLLALLAFALAGLALLMLIRGL
jgi:hypothetical protein